MNLDHMYKDASSTGKNSDKMNNNELVCSLRSSTSHSRWYILFLAVNYDGKKAERK